jgi:hypothetical protein
MELPRGEDEPLIERRRHPEESASYTELEALTTLAEELLTYTETLYGAESIRRGKLGTFTLQSSVMEEDGVNVLKSGMYVTGPNFPNDRTDVITEFEFGEDFAYPTVTFRSDHTQEELDPDSEESKSLLLKHQQRGREVLIELVTSGKLDKTESAMALYCLSHIAGIVDDLATDLPTGLISDEADEPTPFCKAIADQIAARTRDFTSIRNLVYEDIIDDYELTVTAIAPSNPKRPTDLPRLQLVLAERGRRSMISLVLRPDGSYIAVDNDPYSPEPPLETPPEIYQVQRLTQALSTALAYYENARTSTATAASDNGELMRFIPKQPYAEQLDTAKRAWLAVLGTEEGTEAREEADRIYVRAIDLLRREFESRYHLMPGRDEEGEDILLNLPNAPHFNMHHFHGFRNMLKLATPRVLMLIGDDFHEWPVHEDTGFIAEYTTLEGGTIADENGNETHDIFLITKPYSVTAQTKCIVPLSSIVVLEFSARNN